jgi:hypothetical protein
LPDDNTVLFTAATDGEGGYDKSRVEAFRLDTGERSVIVDGGYAARYLATGHLIYAKGGVLLMAPFDAAQLRITGTAVPVLRGVRTDPLSPPEWDLSATGVLVHVPGRTFAWESRLVLASREGKLEELPDIKETSVDSPTFSPDGEKIAFDAGSGQTDVWVYDLRRHVLTRITGDGSSSSPVWSPDGRRIAFISRQGGRYSIHLVDAGGSGRRDVLTPRDNLLANLAFRPDGGAIAFTEYSPATLADIWLISLDGKREPQPVLRTPAMEWMGNFQPGGKWFAYQESQGGEGVYIQTLDGAGKRRVSPGSGTMPVWSREGRELFYINANALTAVTIPPGPDPEPGAPRVLLQLTMGNPGSTSYFDVAPGGNRFVIARIPDAPPPGKFLDVMVNWRPGR